MKREVITVETKRCPHCGESDVIAVDKERYDLWRGGMLIQNAFPEMPKEKREQLITGIHAHCWDAIFGTEQ